MKLIALLWFASGANAMSAIHGLVAGTPAWECCLSVTLAFVLSLMAMSNMRQQKETPND